MEQSRRYLSRLRLARIKAGQEIELSTGGRCRVTRVPFGFPWLAESLDTDSGWTVHWMHISGVH